MQYNYSMLDERFLSATEADIAYDMLVTREFRKLTEPNEAPDVDAIQRALDAAQELPVYRPAVKEETPARVWVDGF